VGPTYIIMLSHGISIYNVLQSFLLVQELHESLMTDVSSLLQKALEKQNALLKSSTDKVRSLSFPIVALILSLVL
jgi:hypothetical protein